MPVQLAPFADVKTLLELEQGTPASYPKYTLLEPLVQAAIASYLGVTFDYATVTERYTVGLDSVRVIPVRRLPISTVTTVLVDGTAWTDYKLTIWGIRLGSAISEAVVDITYTGGYTSSPSPETVPTVLKRAAILQVAYEIQSSDQIGSVSMSTDGGTVSRPELGLLKEVRRLLGPYRHPYFVGIV